MYPASINIFTENTLSLAPPRVEQLVDECFHENRRARYRLDCRMLRTVRGLYFLSGLPSVVGVRTSVEEFGEDEAPRAEGGPESSDWNGALRSRGISVSGEVQLTEHLLGTSTLAATSRHDPAPGSTSAESDLEVDFDSPSTDFLLLEDAGRASVSNRKQSVAAATLPQDARLEKHEAEPMGAAAESFLGDFLVTGVPAKDEASEGTSDSEDSTAAPEVDAAWHGRTDAAAGSAFSNVVDEAASTTPLPYCEDSVDYINGDYWLADLCAVKLGTFFAPTSSAPQVDGSYFGFYRHVNSQGYRYYKYEKCPGTSDADNKWLSYNGENFRHWETQSSTITEDVVNAALPDCHRGYVMANKMRQALLGSKAETESYNLFYDELYSNGVWPTENDRGDLLRELGVQDVAELERLIMKYYIGQGHGTNHGGGQTTVDLHAPRIRMDAAGDWKRKIREDWSWMCAVVCAFLDGKKDPRTECVAYSFSGKDAQMATVPVTDPVGPVSDELRSKQLRSEGSDGKRCTSTRL